MKRCRQLVSFELSDLLKLRSDLEGIACSPRRFGLSCAAGDRAPVVLTFVVTALATVFLRSKEARKVPS